MEFIKDFGDTATLMLTVASPKTDAVELTLRARQIRTAIEQARATVAPGGARGSRVDGLLQRWMVPSRSGIETS